MRQAAPYQVDDAILICEIMGQNQLANRDPALFLQSPVATLGIDDDEFLRCNAGPEPCDFHEEPWDCVAAAVGADETSVKLYMQASCHVSELSSGDVSDETLVRTEAFGRPEATELDEIDLETAALLREGWLPPGWIHVSGQRPLENPAFAHLSDAELQVFYEASERAATETMEQADAARREIERRRTGQPATPGVPRPEPDRR